MKKISKMPLIIGLAVLTIAMVMHWGFMGIVVAGIGYGLWAEKTK